MKFNFLTWNTQGDTLQRVQDLCLLIKTYQPDIMTLQETALLNNPSLLANELVRLGYKVERANASPNKGLITAFSSTFVKESSSLLHYDSSLSKNPNQPGAPTYYRRPLCVVLHYNVNYDSKTLKVINSYNTTGAFARSELKSLFDYLNSQRGKMIIAGDFNFGENFNSIVGNEKYTWYHMGIDYIVVKDTYDVNNAHTGKLSSDHNWVVVEVNTDD